MSATRGRRRHERLQARAVAGAVTRVTRATRGADRPASTVMNEAVTEDSFKQTVIDYAHLRGWLVHHAKPAVKHDRWATWQDGDNGFPDLVLAREGVVIFAELKREKGKVTVDQQAWRWALGAGRPGCTAYVWRPSDWPQIERVLR